MQGGTTAQRELIIWFGVTFGALRMSIGGISAIYLLSRGLSVEDIGYLKAFQAAVILASDIPLSYISDKISKTFSILLATVFAAVWLLVTGLSSSFSGFMIAELFNALSLSLFGGAFTALLLNEVPADRKKLVLSNYFKRLHMAMAITALIGPVFVRDISSGVIWITVSLLMALTAVFGFIVLPSDLKDKGEAKKSIFLVMLDDWKYITRSLPVILIPILSLVAVLFVNQVIIQFWQPVVEKAINIGDAGYIWGATFFVILMAQSLSSYLVEKANTKRYTMTAIALLSIAICAIYFFVPKNIYTIVMVVGVFMVVRALIIIVSSWFHTKVEDTYRASIDSVKSSLASIFVIAMMPLVGEALDKFISVQV